MLLALCAHKGQWCGALMFSFICAWINSQVNNREAGHLRRHHAHHDVIVMYKYHGDAHLNMVLGNRKPIKSHNKNHQVLELPMHWSSLTISFSLLGSVMYETVLRGILSCHDGQWVLFICLEMTGLGLHWLLPPFFRQMGNDEILQGWLHYFTYRQISNIRCTLAGNQIVDHSDVVGLSPVGFAQTTSSFST